MTLPLSLGARRSRKAKIPDIVFLPETPRSVVHPEPIYYPSIPGLIPLARRSKRSKKSKGMGLIWDTTSPASWVIVLGLLGGALWGVLKEKT